MNFELNEEQKMLREMSRSFLETNCPSRLVRQMEDDERGYPDILYKQMAEMGWMGLVIPERYGGSGGSYLDLAVLLEEMGRANMPGPFFSTSVSGVLYVLEGATDAKRNTLLSKIAKGNSYVSMALSEEGTEYNPRFMKTNATRDGDTYVINGTKLFVDDVHLADTIICAARTNIDKDDSITLFLVDALANGSKYYPLKTMVNNKQFEVIFDRVRVPIENALGDIGGGTSLLTKVQPKLAVAKSMETLGAARRLLEMSINHAKERVQFDRRIGSFQAIQHYCANMFLEITKLEAIAYRAAWLISENLPYHKEAYMAKAQAADSMDYIIRYAVQIHGGMGVMKEHDVQLYLRRARAAEVSMGNVNFCREKVAEYSL